MFMHMGLVDVRILLQLSQVLSPKLHKMVDYTPLQLVEGGYTGITLSVRLSVCLSVRLSVCLSFCPPLSGVFLGYLSINLSQTVYTSLSSYDIVHL